MNNSYNFEIRVKKCSISNFEKMIEEKMLETSINTNIIDMRKLPIKEEFDIYDDFEKKEFSTIQTNIFRSSLANASKDNEDRILEDKIDTKLQNLRNIPEDDTDQSQLHFYQINNESFQFISNNSNKTVKDKILEDTIDAKINDLRQLKPAKEESDANDHLNLNQDEKNEFLENDKYQNKNCGFNYMIRNIIRLYRRIFRNKK